MSVDASSTAVGAVLLQDDYPIYYASKTLTAIQQNMAQIEKELYAIVFGCIKFHQFIYGQTVKVETDHRPLVTLFKKPLADVPTRLQRMMLRIQAYQLKVSYKKGSQMYLADTLSRAPLPETVFDDLEDEIMVHVNLLIKSLPVSAEKLRWLQDATNADESMQSKQKNVHKSKEYYDRGTKTLSELKEGEKVMYKKTPNRNWSPERKKVKANNSAPTWITKGIRISCQHQATLLNGAPGLGSILEKDKVNLTQLINKYSLFKSHISEDGKLNFTELAIKYGQQCEEHEVTTDDGYILKMFHIPGKGRPILLMHGIIDTSDTFLKRGNISMVITLAKAGYDVWAGNFRGNSYSQGHTTLDSNVDKEYWNFSLHELGYYDYSAFIDYVINKTGKKKITVIGHSQGTTTFFVLNSLRPDYNNKINIFIGLAPVAFLTHLKGVAKLAVKLAPELYISLKALGIEKIFNDNSTERNLVERACTQEIGSYELCFNGAIFPAAGFDSEEIEPEFAHVIFGYYPNSSPLKGLYHFAQIASNKRFADFDYGTIKNLAKYGTSTPPEFDLTKVTAKVALLVGENDYLSVVEDVETLKGLLPNVVKYQVLPCKQFNHLDFVWGKNMPKHLYPHLFEILNIYS
ncbi:lipase 1-like [Aphomia sociella]